MEHSRNEALEDKLLSEMMQWMGDERIHPTVTDLIYCMTKSFMFAKNPTLQRSRKTKMFFLLGLGLEKALLGMRGGLRVELHPSLDGIGYHVDSLMEVDLTEVKSTRQGITLNPDTFSMGWKRQILAYLKAVGLTECDFAIIHIIQAELQCWHVKFTQEEIDTNWEWVRDYRKPVWDSAMATGIPPTPFTTNEDWECRDCELLAYCKGTTRR